MVLYYRCSFIGGVHLLLTELLNSTDVTIPRVFFLNVSFTSKHLEQKL